MQVIKSQLKYQILNEKIYYIIYINNKRKKKKEMRMIYLKWNEVYMKYAWKKIKEKNKNDIFEMKWNIREMCIKEDKKKEWEL